MVSLRQAYLAACNHWDGRPGERCMDAFVRPCCEIVGWDRPVEGLSQADAVDLLGALRGSKSAKTVATYYGAFKRMLKLNGVDVASWPSAPTPPRKTRDPMKGEDIDKLIGWLDENGFGGTADLGRLLRATGARIDIEALSAGHCRYSVVHDADLGSYGVLHLQGKGGHERDIPVMERAGRDVLEDPKRLACVRSISADTHRLRWRKGVAALGIDTRLATPHAVRHYYACEAYRKSGGNLVMVQELLGHADPKTTAGYLKIDMGAKAAALMGQS